MSLRLNGTFDMITNLISKYQPDEVAVEDYARRFSKGRSSANTIIVLSTFNEVVCLAAYRALNKDVFKYPAVTVRSQVGKLFGTKIVSKENVFLEILLRSRKYQIELTRYKNIKEECMDVVDAIAVGIAHISKRSSNAKRYSI